MAFDPSDYRGITLADEHAVKPERCSVKDCDHADEDELINCDSCGAVLCAKHLVTYTENGYCQHCDMKMKAALTITSLELSRLQADILIGGIDAETVAERLISLSDTLSDWDIEMDNIEIEKQAFASEPPDRWFTVKAFYLKHPNKGDALVEIYRDGEPYRRFLFPAYKIWNIAAHFSDIVDGEIEGNYSGYDLAGWTGFSVIPIAEIA